MERQFAALAHRDNVLDTPLFGQQRCGEEECSRLGSSHVGCRGGAIQSLDNLAKGLARLQKRNYVDEIDALFWEIFVKFQCLNHCACKILGI